MRQAVQAVWFKRDLRIHDHRALALAAQQGPVLPFFVAEPDFWQQPDASGRQWAFVAESLAALQQDLEAIGQPLTIEIGSVTDVLARLHKEIGISTLWSHEETGNGWTYERDKQVADWCRQNGVPWKEQRQTGVIRGLAKRDGWAARWDRFMSEAPTDPPSALVGLNRTACKHIPTAAELGIAPDVCPHRQRGGRLQALEVMDSFFSCRGETYRSTMSSPNTAFRTCSRLSPHLAWGTISMREVAQAANRRRISLREDASAPRSQWRGSMSSFSGRLHWHCHFMQKLEDQPSIEWSNFHPAYDGLRPASPETAHFEAWSRGETGLPFVDACVRALKATGWLNFRMRAMLMSVASFHLWIDWRKPGEQLARQFTDYEPGIHWPQVQMQSGTSGINTVRIYNPIKQGIDQDPDGAFVRKWVPELADVPDQFLHEPWTWEAAGQIIGKTYPMPIVDHLDAAKQARQRIWAVRSGPDYRSVARSIQEKHGSRKSGVRGVARKRKEKRDKDQLAFDL